MSTTHRTTHDDPPQRINGHLSTPVNGPATASPVDAESAGGAAPPSGSRKRYRARAASDDAHRTPVAPAPGPPAASAPGDASAEVARDSNGNSESGAAAESLGPDDKAKNPADRGGETNGSKTTETGAEQKPAREPLPPGTRPLPADASAFVSAVHEQADLIEVGRRLLNSKDEKIIKGVWDRLVNLKFGKAEGESDQDPQRIVIDIPGAQREWPDEQ